MRTEILFQKKHWESDALGEYYAIQNRDRNMVKT